MAKLPNLAFETFPPPSGGGSYPRLGGQCFRSFLRAVGGGGSYWSSSDASFSDLVSSGGYAEFFRRARSSDKYFVLAFDASESDNPFNHVEAFNGLRELGDWMSQKFYATVSHGLEVHFGEVRRMSRSMAPLVSKSGAPLRFGKQWTREELSSWLEKQPENLFGGAWDEHLKLFRSAHNGNKKIIRKQDAAWALMSADIDFIRKLTAPATPFEGVVQEVVSPEVMITNCSPLAAARRAVDLRIVETYESPFRCEALFPTSPKPLRKRDGFCYLRLFPRAFRSVAWKALGAYPSVSEVAHFAVGVYLRTGVESFKPWRTDVTINAYMHVHYHPAALQDCVAETMLQCVINLPRLIIGAPSRAGASAAMDVLGGTIHKDNILAGYVQQTNSSLALSARLCPNHVPEPLFSDMVALGVPLDPNSPGRHPHPAHKALEEVMLESFSNRILNPVTVLFMKDSKFRRWRARQPALVELLNPVLGVRDSSRWRSDLVDYPTSVIGKDLFLHDVGHYLSQADVLALFDLYPGVERVFFTAILPLEALHDLPNLHPNLYSVESLSDTEYVYRLREDGESYEQPRRTLSWLTTRSIVAPDKHTRFPGARYPVERLHSVAAHHLFVVSRQDYPITRNWYCPPLPPLVRLPEINGRSLPRRSRIVPSEVYASVLAHSASLSTRKFENTMAKVRTFMSSPRYSHYDTASWFALAHHCYSFSEQPGVLSPDITGPSVFGPSLANFRRTCAVLDAAALPFALVSYGAAFWAIAKSAASLPVDSLVVRVLSLLPGHVPTLVVSCLVTAAVSWSLNRGGSHYSIADYIDRQPQRLCLALPLRDASVSYHGPRRVLYGPIPGPRDDGSECPDHMPPFDGLSGSGSISSWLSSISVDPDPSAFGEAWTLPSDFDSDKREVLQPSISSNATSSDGGGSRESGGSSLSDGESGESVRDSVFTLASSEAVSSGGSSSGETISSGSPSDASARSDSSAVEIASGPDGTYREFIRSGAPGESADRLEGPPRDLQFDHALVSYSGSGCRDLFQIAGLTADQVLEPVGAWSFPEPCSYLPPLPVAQCLLTALNQLTGIPVREIWARVGALMPESELAGAAVDMGGLTTAFLVGFAYAYDLQVRVVGCIPEGHPVLVGMREPGCSHFAFTSVTVSVSPGHWSPFGTSAPLVRGAFSPRAAAPLGSLSTNLGDFPAYLAQYVDDRGNPAVGSWHRYRTQPQRAKAYARDLKNGFTGTLLRQEGNQVPAGFTARVDSVIDAGISRFVDVTYICGAPGSSKSTSLRSALRNGVRFIDSNAWKVCLPRVTQREDWVESLHLGRQSWKVGTFETSLNKSGSCLVVDEVGQLPPGYVDYALARDPGISSVVLLGDVCQGTFHEPNPESSMKGSIGEASYWRRYADSYRAYSYTVPRVIAGGLGLTSFSREEGYIRRISCLDTRWPVVCATTQEVRMYSELGHESYSFQTVQGRRFHDRPVQLVMSSSAVVSVSDGLLSSALCRSSKGVLVLITATASAVRAARHSSIRSFALRLAGRHDPYEVVFRDELFGMRLTKVPVVRGAFSGELSLPLGRAPPFLRALLTAPPPEHVEYRSHDDAFELGPGVALPRDSETFVFESFGDLTAREVRERYGSHPEEVSQQFRDVPRKSDSFSSNYESWFPRHMSSDLVTFNSSVAKRLRFRDLESNYRDYVSKEALGPVLFRGFCAVSGLDPGESVPFDPDLYLRCILENEFSKLTKKTQSVLLNNESHSDPDWRHTFIRIFLKQQLKVKTELVQAEFKPGQTLALFHDSVILITGPMTRYMTALDEPRFRESLYYHSGRSPLQLSSWCQSHWKDKGGDLCNDYTAYDQSQTGEALSFEVVRMRHYSIPENVIEYYLDVKLNLRCQFGPLQTLRHTGEGPTWKFNSDFNTAVTGCQYALEPGQPVAISGDDQAINGRPGELSTWPAVRKRLTLVSKVVYPRWSEFCSWILTPFGVVKDPVNLCFKMKLAEERGELGESLPSLTSELAVGYHLGDHLFEVLDPLQLAAQSVCVRRAVKFNSTRFALMLSRRSLADILAEVGSGTASVIRGLQSEAWMLHSDALRFVASLYRGVELGSIRGFNRFITLA